MSMSLPVMYDDRAAFFAAAIDKFAERWGVSAVDASERVKLLGDNPITVERDSDEARVYRVKIQVMVLEERGWDPQVVMAVVDKDSGKWGYQKGHAYTESLFNYSAPVSDLSFQDKVKAYLVGTETMEPVSVVELRAGKSCKCEVLVPIQKAKLKWSWWPVTTETVGMEVEDVYVLSEDGGTTFTVLRIDERVKNKQ